MTINTMITDTLSAKEAEKGVSVDDLVKVVRCKDCKWFNQPFENEGMCIKHDHDFHDTDWFCADGERKE